MLLNKSNPFTQTAKQRKIIAINGSRWQVFMVNNKSQDHPDPDKSEVT